MRRLISAMSAAAGVEEDVHIWNWLDRLAAQDVLWVQGSGVNHLRVFH